MKETLEVINQMQRDGVIDQYAIGGAVGALYYLEAASTVDVHIFVKLPTFKRSQLLDLSPIYEYMRKRGFKTDKEYIVVGKWPVQFLPPADALEEEALEHAENIEVEGVETRVMSSEYLVAIALKVGRAKDHARNRRFPEAKSSQATRPKERNI